MVFFIFQENQPFERIEVSRDEALEIFSDNNFKASESVIFIIIKTILCLATFPICIP
jgi:hypothetical protein